MVMQYADASVGFGSRGRRKVKDIVAFKAGTEESGLVVNPDQQGFWRNGFIMISLISKVLSD